jgi:hypothetical protein
MATKIDLQVESELQRKLKLEGTFKKEIRRLFNSIQLDFRTTLAGSGHSPSAELFKTRWESVLKGHYERVQKVFTKKNLIETKRTAIEEDEDEGKIAALLLLLANWKEETAKKAAGHITDTTNDNMRKSIIEARGILTDRGEAVTNRSLAALAATILRRKFKGRVNGIAVIETQETAEFAKEETAKSIVGIATKAWRSKEDLLVRPTHKIANRQKRLIGALYSVGGQLLMFPGDRSHGATAKEWAGCRCSSIIFVAGVMLEF